MDKRIQEIIDSINREKLSKEPNVNTIRMLQQNLEGLLNQDKDKT